jgi:hypothetical protein
MFPNHRRCRLGQGEMPGQRVGPITLDNNSYANHAIKRALGVHRKMLRGFETCHIWPMTCYDPRYHTAIANLVLLPRALAGLADHDEYVQRALQFRAFELYQWFPEEADQPKRPADYPEGWLPPLPFTSIVARALGRRVERLTGVRSCEGVPEMPHTARHVALEGSVSGRSQRDVMRELVRRFGSDEDRVVRKYAAAEERGEVVRSLNERGSSALEYARRLWADGVKKGWLS